jgi:hypothetical protein
VLAVQARDAGGRVYEFDATQVISTMPIKDLVAALDPPPPPEIAAIAAALPYRDFISVGLLLKGMRANSQADSQHANHMPPDNWIYIQEPTSRRPLADLQQLEPRSRRRCKISIWLGLEYFCKEGDDLWRLDDKAMIAFAAEELERIGMINRADVLDGTVLRVPKTYPGYFGAYAEFPRLRAWLDGIENLFLVGRNGMHRYNNQDHSMLTAKLAVEAILAGRSDKAPIWAVNVDDDYHDAMPALHRYLGNPVLSTLARVMYGIPIADFHCGMRAFTREAFERMNPRTPGMEFATEMVINASHAGLRIAEIPTRLYPDKRDRAPHLRSFRDGWRHLRFMLTYAPDWLYLMPGSILSLIGVLGMALLAPGPVEVGNVQLGIHFLAVASLFTLLGANVIWFGLLARLTNAQRNPVRSDSSFGRLLRYFTLERGLILGAGLTASGFAIDVWILIEWISRGYGDMAGTVHIAFVASTVLILGVNAIFGVFLLNMVRDERTG